MRSELIAGISSGQDGAIWGGFFFRFKSNGECCVYQLSDLTGACGEQVAPFSTFCLDKAEILMPHSNAVCFGSEYAEAGDEFPLLYTNIYNSYAKAADRREGTCCVYRLQRRGDRFSTQLVQVIQIGFSAVRGLWRSKETADVRPYGNFTVDRARGVYYAFTMLDGEMVTRYFAFRLPAAADGQWEERFGARCAALREQDVMDSFDCPYHHYLQGACVHGNRIYSLEGFTDDNENPPALRVIDPAERRQIACVTLGDIGLTEEPEWIDFYDGQCFYADHAGNVYRFFE